MHLAICHDPHYLIFPYSYVLCTFQCVRHNENRLAINPQKSMKNYIVNRNDPNILELIESVNFIAIVINRQLQLFWSFMSMIMKDLFQIVCLFSLSDQLRKSIRNRARFLHLRLDCINFSVTFMNRRLRKFWSFLCRSFIATPRMFSTVFSRIVSLFGAIYVFLFLRKSPSDKLQKSMDTQDRFPLLNLDYVAIREVLNTLDPIDYINFSKASKSCRILSTIKKPYKVKLNFTSSPAIWFWNGSLISGMKWNKDASISRLFWWQDKPLDAMMEFYLDAKILMGVELDSVVLYMDDFEGECREIVDWLRSIRQEVSGFYIYGKNQRHEDVQYILDNLKFKDSLHIFAHTNEQLPLRIPESVDQLMIRHGSWITMDYIMSLKMRMMAFHHTKLTNQDINVFYKSWIEMKSHQSLKWLEINITNLEGFIAVALRDIPYEMGRITNHAEVAGPFVVTRKDGLTASISVYENGTGFDAIMLTSFPIFQREAS